MTEIEKFETLMALLTRELTSPDGFCVLARSGRFSAEKARPLLDAINRLQVPYGGVEDAAQQRELIAVLWNLPYFLDRQARRILKGGSDIYNYVLTISEVREAVARVLNQSLLWDDIQLGYDSPPSEPSLISSFSAYDQASEALAFALGEEADTVLGAAGLARSAQSLVYQRVAAGSFQRLALVPIAAAGVNFSGTATLATRVQVDMPTVGDVLLGLLGGEDWRLSSPPARVVDQPIDTIAPEPFRRTWAGSSGDNYGDIVADFTSFVWKWVVPFLDQLRDAESLTQLYDNDDVRILQKTREWYLKVASAFVLLDRPESARMVLLKHLPETDRRRGYALTLMKLRGE